MALLDEVGQGVELGEVLGLIAVARMVFEECHDSILVAQHQLAESRGGVVAVAKGQQISYS